MEKCPKPVRRLTRYGYCYYYKLSNSIHGNISIAGPQSSLIFYGAYNKENFLEKTAYNMQHILLLICLINCKKSDTTTGALQFVDGMTLFYCDANEDVMIPKESFSVIVKI